ncbi:unnamed protein product [Clonostachys chloroleuca]|uniref:CFEM domain-containing protein n=1 Tax=Clonostachys chloroleuca TaxID=1926264 RepID=A0AA35VQK1_9HYPO|nr:unnamed protein product [Clonostachys chloroleuca]
MLRSQVLVLVLVLATEVLGIETTSILSELKNLPACGTSCFTSVINDTPCDIFNATCICTDSTFHDAAQACITSNCPAQEALNASKVEARVCERPYRTRKYVLFIPIIVEGPSWFCPWIRLYSRWLTLGRWELDDWVMFGVGLLYSVFLVLGNYTGYLAFGIDMWNLEYETITTALKYFYICESFYILSLALCKVSVLFFYLRIFPSQKFLIATYVSMAIIMVPSVVLIFIQIFQCMPIHWVWHGWRLAYYRDRCMDIHTITFVAAGLNIFQDLVVLLLPLPSLFRLKMEKRSKWGIIVIFSLGIFITITSCIRLRYVSLFGRSANPTWEYPEVLIWTGIELSVTIIVACLPAIWVLLKHLFPWIGTTISTGYNKDKTPGSKDALRANRGVESQKGYFKTKSCGRRTESQVELEYDMELGDRSQGDVQTLVSEDRSPRPDQLRRVLERNDNGIMVVKTVTTTSRSVS